MTMDRRTVLKGAAWAVPVIALTTAVPAQATSGACENPVYIYDPRDYADNNFGTAQNVAKITVAVGSHVEVEFIRDTGHPHVNLNYDGTGAKNTHIPRQVKAGEVFTFPLDDCLDPYWVQVSGNNIHYYRGGRWAN